MMGHFCAFLVACTRLVMSLCRSIGRSVGRRCPLVTVDREEEEENKEVKDEDDEKEVKDEG